MTHIRFVRRKTGVFKLVNGRLHRSSQAAADRCNAKVEADVEKTPIAWQKNDFAHCWRCGGFEKRIRVYGVPCTPCSQVLINEYDAAKRRTGKRWLYLPDSEGTPARPYDRITASYHAERIKDTVSRQERQHVDGHAESHDAADVAENRAAKRLVAIGPARGRKRRSKPRHQSSEFWSSPEMSGSHA